MAGYGGSASITYVSALPVLRKILDEEIRGEIKSNRKVQELKDFSKTKNLEDLLMPKFSVEKMEDERDGFLIHVPCESKQKGHFSMLHKLYLDTVETFAQYGETRGMPILNEISLGRTNNKSIFVIKGRAIPSDDFLFKTTYQRNDVEESSGDLYIRVSQRLAENPEMAKKLVVSLWKNIVLDEERLSSVYGEGVDGSELGLRVYKGSVKMDDIGGYRDVKRMVDRDVFYPFKNNLKLEKITKQTRKGGLQNPTRAVLFYGLPGTGKTLTASAIANENGMNFIYLSLPNMYSKWYGESARKMTEILDSVELYSKRHGKTVFFIDEIDAIGKRSGEESGTGNETNRVIDTLLMKMDGLATDRKNKNLMIVASTNNYGAMDPGILSRFGSKIHFDKPSREDREEIFSLHAKHLNKSDWESMAAKTEGLVGRDISMIAGIAERNFSMDLDSNKTGEKLPTLQYYISAISEFMKESQFSKPPSGLYV